MTNPFENFAQHSPQQMPAFPVTQPPAQKSNSLGIAGLICASVGTVISCIPFYTLPLGWLSLFIGFVLGFCALFMKGQSLGMAIAAVVTAGIGAILSFFILLAILVAISDSIEDEPSVWDSFSFPDGIRQVLYSGS